MAQVGRKRYIPFRVTDIDGNAVDSLALVNFSVTHLRNGLLTTSETFALEAKGNGLYCATYTPLTVGQDYVELYNATHDVRIGDDEYIDDGTGGTGGDPGTGETSQLVYLTQDTGGTGVLKVDVNQPQTFTLYIFKSQTWQSGDHHPLSAEVYTQLDANGNWLRSPLPVLRDIYHVVVMSNQGETHIIRPFLDLTDPLVDPEVPPAQVVYTGVSNETPTGLCNGVNTLFTLADTPIVGTDEVFLNGMLLEPGAGNDYLLIGNTLTLAYPPSAGDKLRVYYNKPAQGTPLTGTDPDIVVDTETPSGAVNGNNTAFTTAFIYKPSTTRVFLNGIRLKTTDDYVEAGGNQLSFVVPPFTGDVLLIDYVVKP